MSTRRVLLFDTDVGRLAGLAESVHAIDAEPLIVSSMPPAALARGAAAVVAAEEEGHDLLARLLLDYPSLPRIAVVGRDASVTDLIAIVERVRPFAIVPTPLERGRLESTLREIFISHSEGGHTTELTRRTLVPAPADFERLVVDGLTGVAGYHYLRLRLDEELERAARYARPVSLVLIDIDDLRGLNDRHGRTSGDFALRQLGAMLASGARAVDLVGRWAGGAFALVLPETTAGAAFGLAERMRADIAARRFAPTPDDSTGRLRAPFRLTISAGVACTVRDGVSRPLGLVQRADAALFRAKSNGRNRSVRDG
jgi:diguanylate cyclase (GGDEF)-like protein